MRPPKYTGKKQIAPRLANGEKRVNWGGRLPADFKHAMQMQAVNEGRSLSYVLERLVQRVRNLPTPDYVKPKKVKT